MNALLNEYRAWRDAKIEECFEDPVADADELKEGVESFLQTVEYNIEFTLVQYQEAQNELLKEDIPPEDLIHNTILWWISIALDHDDWDALFQAHEPQTESEEESEEESETEAQA